MVCVENLIIREKRVDPQLKIATLIQKNLEENKKDGRVISLRFPEKCKI